MVVNIQSAIILFCKGKAASNLSAWEIIKAGWKEIGQIPGLRKFLIARMLYVDGLTVVFAFAEFLLLRYSVLALKMFYYLQSR